MFVHCLLALCLAAVFTPNAVETQLCPIATEDFEVIGETNPSDGDVVSGLAEHNGNAVYRIETDGHFLFEELCFTCNCDIAQIKPYDGSLALHNIRVFNQNDGDMISACVTSYTSPVSVSKVTIRFIANDFYLAGNISIDGLIDCPGPTCGLSQYPDAGVMGGAIPAPFIVGGVPARINELPWQVAIVPDFDLNRVVCGGVLIDPFWIITAAHCLFYSDISTYRVHLGLANLVDLEGVSTSTVEETIEHPENDMALMRLPFPVENPPSAVRICMPQQHPAVIAGEHMVTSGWGDTISGGSGSDDLLFINVPLMEGEACIQCMDHDPRHEVCAGVCGSNLVDSCQGDSGGPLAWKNSDGSYELIGIVTRGIGCASSTPGVYESIYASKDWLLTHLPLLDFGPSCPDDEFQCYNGTCIPGAYECDQIIDCTLGEDEDDCLYCERIYDEPPGSLTSPYFPGFYFDNLWECWAIQTQNHNFVGSPFTQITIMFLDLDLFSNDFLLIESFGGDTFMNLTGAPQVPIFITILDGGVNITFSTDSDGTGGGFALFYQPASQDCGSSGVLDAAEGGTILSPNHPDPYTDDLICSWVIKADDNYMVQLTVNSFEIEACCDHFYVSDGFTVEQVFNFSQANDIDFGSQYIFITFAPDDNTVFSGFNISYTQLLVPCADTEYQCLDGACIPLSWVCDNIQDCSQFEDEINCTNGCNGTDYACLDGQCIPLRWVCDNITDCSLGEDENGCSGPGCNGTDYACLDGQCIPLSWVCDNITDCSLGEDENGCNGCNGTDYACLDGQCIPLSWVCDNITDCSLGEDENGCNGCLTVSNAAQGTLTSPNFPDEYPNNVDICWILEFNTPILLTPIFFDLEEGFDFLTITDNNGTLIWLGSGTEIPDLFPFLSETGFIIRFTTDSSVTELGFALHYQVASSCCGSARALYAGHPEEISSPGYPISNYSNYEICSWVLYADEGFSPALMFNEFILEEDFDFLYVSDGLESDFAMTGVATLRTHRAMIPHSRYLFLTFTSDFSITSIGFSVTYFQIPDTCAILCDDGITCISEGDLCDGVENCPNGEDEDDLQCGCSSNEYTCLDGECIPLTYLCDDIADCSQVEDEANC